MSYETLPQACACARVRVCVSRTPRRLNRANTKPPPGERRTEGEGREVGWAEFVGQCVSAAAAEEGGGRGRKGVGEQDGGRGGVRGLQIESGKMQKDEEGEEEEMEREVGEATGGTKKSEMVRKGEMRMQR